MENVTVDANTRKPDFFDKSKTENTRGSYKLSALSKVYEQTREAKAPKRIIFLTADAFGALPAVARLDHWQTQYHFMSGYTAKVAGTELGVTEPKAAFSACFGAPFMPRSPSVYASLLAKKVAESGASVWLLNTGWVGGYEQGGKRFPLKITRALLQMIQTGELDQATMVKHPIFGFEVPANVAGIDSQYLQIPTGPAVEKLAALFDKNMDKFKNPEALEIRRKGGPRVASAARPAEASL